MPIRIRRPAGDVTSSPNADNSSFLTRMGGLRGLLGTGVRIGSGILASPGGLFGAGVGALGETGAELVEGSKPNPARVGVEAGLAAVPLSSVFKLGRMGESALRSGAMSAAGTAGRELAQGESLNPRAIAEAGASGGLLGGLFSKLGGGAPEVGKKAPEPFYEVEQTAQKGGQTLGPGGSGVRSTQPIQRIKGNGMPSMRGENPGLAGLGAESSEDFYPSVSVGGPSEGPIYRSATKQALARDAEEFLQDEVKPAEAQSKLNDKEAKNRTKLDLVNQLLSGKTRGAVTGGESIAAETEGGLTRRASIRFKKQAGAKAPSEAPKKVTRAQQLGGIEPRLPAADATQEVGARVGSSGAAARIGESDAGTKALEELEALTGGSGIRTVAGRGTMPAESPANLERSTSDYGESINGGVDVTPANLTRVKNARSEQRSLQGGAEVGYGSVEDGLEGFGPSGVPPTGLARFFGVQEPLGSPRKPKAPSLKAQAQAESEHMLKQKMADEATPRPSEWDQYPPEVAQELDRLGLLYRSAPEGLEKRGLGAQLSELKMFMSGKRKDGTSYMKDSWKGAAPPAAEVPATAPPPAAPEAPDWVKEQSSLVDQLKDLYKNQKGAVSNELGMRLGLGLGGAAIGAAADPLDNRYESGAAGFAAGAALPSLPNVTEGLPGLMKKLGAAPEAVQEIQQRAQQEGPRATAQRLMETFPQYQRFNMLMSVPGLAANAIAGPWGSAMTGALEAGLSGDQRGWRLAQSLLTKEAFQKAPEAWDEAVRLIEQGDLGRAETIFGTSLLAQLMMLPGTAMTTGDVTARHVIESAGFPEDAARTMTMTNEPEFKAFQKVANFTKDSPALQTIMPFTRTLANLGEQGLMRAPIIGSMVQALREAPDDVKTQIVQQGMSVGIGGANYFLGQQLDPESAKLVRRFSTNIAGRYGLAASVGFAAGQASQKGQDVLSTAGVRGIQEALPLPTTDIPESYVRQLSNFLNDKPVTPPAGLMPRDLQDKLFPPQQTSAPRAPRIRIRRP